MIRKKLNTVTSLASGSADLDATIDCANLDEFSIQVNHGSGSSTIAKLQASNDNVNYVDVTDSQITLNTNADSHIWNVTEYQSQYCKVVIDGDAVDCEILISKEV